MNYLLKPYYGRITVRNPTGEIYKPIVWFKTLETPLWENNCKEIPLVGFTNPLCDLKHSNYHFEIIEISLWENNCEKIPLVGFTKPTVWLKLPLWVPLRENNCKKSHWWEIQNQLWDLKHLITTLKLLKSHYGKITVRKSHWWIYKTDSVN